MFLVVQKDSNIRTPTGLTGSRMFELDHCAPCLTPGLFAKALQDAGVVSGLDGQAFSKAIGLNDMLVRPI